MVSWMRFNMVALLTLLLFLTASSFAAVKKKRFDIQETAAPAVVSDVPAVVEDAPIVRKDESSFSILVWISSTQKYLREKVSGQIHQMKSGDNGAIWKYLVICFLYGMLHALGPGHGKSIVVGFFLARRGRWRQGVALGAGITFAHTLSAVLLLFILYGIFKATVFPFFEMGREGVEKASYGLLVFTGLLLIVLGVSDYLKSRKKDPSKPQMGPSVASWKEIVGLAAITGIVPCPAVALIVLFCLLNEMVFFALVGAIVICLGMMVTNISFGIAAVAFRKGIDKGSAGSRFATKIYMFASITGGAIVMISGILLFQNC